MPTFRDKLAHLKFRDVCKILGPQGDDLIRQGGKHDVNIDEQVEFKDSVFRLNLGDATASITDRPEESSYVNFQCSSCLVPCEHVGAAFALVLEEKLTLGLSAPPPERLPVESLKEEELVQRAIAERVERMAQENMQCTPVETNELWTDYIVTNKNSGKTYRVALRGWERGDSYCSCPDFRKNTLGTCKHILFVIDNVKKRFSQKKQQEPHRRTRFGLHVHYGHDTELRLLIPEQISPETRRIIEPIAERPIDDVHDLLERIRHLEQAGWPVTIYPDAEELINRRLFMKRIQSVVAEIRQDPANHPLRQSLLKCELLPYQLDGIAFVIGAGRAILADDMGLGKTIQGVGVAVLLERECGISKVLVICPTSLKSQWRNEVGRFTDHACRVVMGSAEERVSQYSNPSFFTICNYEQVLRDFKSIEAVRWDLVILDEGQRIKNWEGKTTRIVKSLSSPFALVLTGTPLENRLEELFSVVEFIDDRRLGPAFRFFNIHKMVDEKGKALGYKNLPQLREKLKPILLRRTRKMVLNDLPPRTTEIIKILPTGEQMEIHDGNYRIVSQIVRKPYLTEMDLLRLQKALLMCRMAANGTYLVDKQAPGYSSKLEELDALLGELLAEDDRKIVLFSEWTTMLDLIEPLIRKRNADYVRLDGSVPQKKRQGLVNQFQKDPACKLFITTNAGSTGLNLQAANTIVNVDLPWNPAILEQRIARAHRMGQKRPVQVYLLVSEGTIEENLLGTLAAKQELALAALDFASDVAEVKLASNMEELKRRLEAFLGAKPDVPIDESEKRKQEEQAERLAKKQRVEQAGGQLISAAFSFISEMLPAAGEAGKAQELAGVFKESLMNTMEKGETGELKLTISLPNESALDNIAAALARMVASRN